MTRKDYIKFATLLKNLKADIYKNNEEEYNFVLNFNDVYSAIVNILQEDNAKFSKREFANYIGFYYTHFKTKVNHFLVVFIIILPEYLN